MKENEWLNFLNKNQINSTVKYICKKIGNVSTKTLILKFWIRIFAI